MKGVFLYSLFEISLLSKKAKHHLLNSPIRCRGVMPYSRWVCAMYVILFVIMLSHICLLHYRRLSCQHSAHFLFCYPCLSMMVFFPLIQYHNILFSSCCLNSTKLLYMIFIGWYANVALNWNGASEYFLPGHATEIMTTSHPLIWRFPLVYLNQIFDFGWGILVSGSSGRLRKSTFPAMETGFSFCVCSLILISISQGLSIVNLFKFIFLLSLPSPQGWYPWKHSPSNPGNPQRCDQQWDHLQRDRDQELLCGLCWLWGPVQERKYGVWTAAAEAAPQGTAEEAASA